MVAFDVAQTCSKPLLVAPDLGCCFRLRCGVPSSSHRHRLPWPPGRLRLMTCKGAVSLPAQTNGEVERGTRYAHRQVAEEEDGTRRRPCSTGGGPTFSGIVKDP